MELQLNYYKSNNQYYICPFCKRPISMNKDFYDNDNTYNLCCPFCKKEDIKENFVEGDFVDLCEPYQWIIYIKFSNSKSKNFNKAKTIAKGLPGFTITDKTFFCGTQNIVECCQNLCRFQKLMTLIQNWKGTQILLFNKPAQFSIDFMIFYERLKAISGRYNKLIMNDNITYENLPYPYVHYPQTYGAFIGFSESIDSEIFFCECEKEAIENYQAIRQLYPLKNYSGDRNNPLDSALFPIIVSQLSKLNTNVVNYKPNICFKCNKIIPEIKYCHPMYGGEFEQKYGWYIQQKYLLNGIDPTRKELGVLLENQCSPEIKYAMSLEQKLKLCQKNTNEYDKLLQIIEDNGDVASLINDMVRVEFGYRGIGEHWINETTLKKIVITLFPNHKIYVHYRPIWLEGLELDIYIPDKALAFEYQGIQHFQAVKQWGSVKQLKIQQEHDKRKKTICDNRRISLIYFDYTENITTEYVKLKILEFL